MLPGIHGRVWEDERSIRTGRTEADVVYGRHPTVAHAEEFES